MHKFMLTIPNQYSNSGHPDPKNGIQQLSHHWHPAHQPAGPLLVLLEKLQYQQLCNFPELHLWQKTMQISLQRPTHNFLPSSWSSLEYLSTLMCFKTTNTSSLVIWLWSNTTQLLCPTSLASMILKHQSVKMDQKFSFNISPIFWGSAQRWPMWSLRGPIYLISHPFTLESGSPSNGPFLSVE